MRGPVAHVGRQSTYSQVRWLIQNALPSTTQLCILSICHRILAPQSLLYFRELSGFKGGFLEAAFSETPQVPY